MFTSTKEWLNDGGKCINLENLVGSGKLQEYYHMESRGLESRPNWGRVSKKSTLWKTKPFAS